MGHRDCLRSLADDELLAGLSRTVGRRNQITAEFLAYLAELDQRQLFLDLGYPSLLPLLRQGARVVRVDGRATYRGGASVPLLPQALDQVARGDLHASALSLMKRHLAADNADPL